MSSCVMEQVRCLEKLDAMLFRRLKRAASSPGSSLLLLLLLLEEDEKDEEEDAIHGAGSCAPKSEKEEAWLEPLPGSRWSFLPPKA